VEINNANYKIQYDQEKNTIMCVGILRLPEIEDYEPIAEFLEEIIDTEPSALTLNVEHLTFLNSTGIAMLSDFILNVREQKQIQLRVIGSSKVSWHNRSLRNLQKLMPSMQLEYM
jgi:hypothetical protein